MKTMFAILLAAVFLHPAYATDSRRQSYSLAGAVVTPDGTMIPKFTVVVRRRTDKPQLIKRLHFTDGLFEVRNLDRGQYSIEITSQLYTGVLLKMQIGEAKKAAEYRIVVMHPVRNDEVTLTDAYTFTLKRLPPAIPPDAESAYLKGVELHRQGRLEEAMMSYGDAIRIFPDYVSALSDIGSIYILLNRPESALTFLRRAQRASPNNIVVMLNMATALVNMKNYSAGIKIFEDILENHDGSSMVRYFLAKAYWDQGKYDTAEKVLGEVLEETPDMIEAWVLLLNLDLERDNQSAARETLLHLKQMLNDVGFSKFIDRQMTASTVSN